MTKSPVHDSAFAQGVRAGAAVPVGTALKSHISLGGRNAVVFSQDQVWTYSPPIILFILFPPSCFILRFLCVMLAAILVGASCAQSLSQSLYANVESVEKRTRTSASPLLRPFFPSNPLTPPASLLRVRALHLPAIHPCPIASLHVWFACAMFSQLSVEDITRYGDVYNGEGATGSSFSNIKSAMDNAKESLVLPSVSGSLLANLGGKVVTMTVADLENGAVEATAALKSDEATVIVFQLPAVAGAADAAVALKANDALVGKTYRLLNSADNSIVALLTADTESPMNGMCNIHLQQSFAILKAAFDTLLMCARC